MSPSFIGWSGFIHIHLNPARAGLVGGIHGKLADYPWSGLRHFATGNAPRWLLLDRVRDAFKLSRDRRGRASDLAWLEARATDHGGAINEEAMESLSQHVNRMRKEPKSAKQLRKHEQRINSKD